MVKISKEEFNREMSRYISSRRTLGKPLHVQIYDLIKDTKKRIYNVKFTSKVEEAEEPVELEIEEKEEPIEEYVEIDEHGNEIKKEKKSFWSFLTRPFKGGSSKDLELNEDIGETGILEEDYEELGEMEEDLEETKEDIEEKKEGIVRRLMNMLAFYRKKPEDEIIEEIEEDTLNEDVKDVLKILTEWIKKLPSEKLKQFKESEDFGKYKAVLKRYGLIKR